MSKSKEKNVNIEEEELDDDTQEIFDKTTKKKSYKNYTITSFDVVAFGPDLNLKSKKCELSKGVPSHAGMIFHHSKGYVTFEYGLLSDDNFLLPDEEEVIPYYRHPHLNLYGCSIKSGTLKDITLKDVLVHGLLWVQQFDDKKGKYPGNCRGYVDSCLEFLGKGRYWLK